MTNNEEKVHVRAYVKDDGTKVKEHYRGLPDGEPARDDDFPNQMQARLEKSTRNSVNSITNVLAGISKYEYTNNRKDLDEALLELQGAHNMQGVVMKQILDRMTYPKSQKEYQRLLTTYIRHRELKQKSDLQLRQILFCYEKGYYPEMQEALNDYRAIYNEEIKRYDNLHDIRRDVLDKSPSAQKLAIDAGLELKKYIQGASDAKDLWKISVQGLDKPSDYIKKNGKVINSVSNLSPRLKSFVTEKIKTQIYKSDCQGIYFHTNSSLSKAIGNSNELKTYIRKNIQTLAAGNTVSNGSVNFTSTENLHLSLGHADIIDMHLDKNNTLKAYVIDTYDFNEDDPSWQVEWAYNVQEQGLITNYYTITEISIPVEEWTRI